MAKEKITQIERKVEKKFNKGCVDFNLLEDGDRILVALSGGKDSLALLKLLAKRSRIFRPHIEVEAAHIVMDNVPYISDLDYLEGFCEECGVRLHVLHSSFDESTDLRKTKCFLCSWNRRKTLFNFAMENKFNKVALGHHQDDILTTLLMNMTFEGSMSTMHPTLRLKHYPLSVIRPLCLVHEEDIKVMSEELRFRKQTTQCPYEDLSKRKAMNDIFHKLMEINPEARFSLWKSIGFGNGRME